MARRTVRSTEPTPALDFDPRPRPQAIPFISDEDAPDAPPIVAAPPPPSIAAAPPPAPDVWPPPRDVWFVELPTLSFDRSLPAGLASPAAIFGMFDQFSHVNDSERRVSTMAKWFRARPNSPVSWIDGELIKVENLHIRDRCTDTNTRECTAARQDWAKAIRGLEIELEQRIRVFLRRTEKERENAASLSAIQMSGGAVPLSSGMMNAAPPPFDVAHFIYLQGTRGVRIEIDETTHRPEFRGFAAGITPADYQTLREFQHEIAAYLTAIAAMAKASAEAAAKAG